MWIFLNNAFVSIVVDRKQPDMLMVRARFKGDIQRAFRGRMAGRKVSETPAADYRYRATLPRETVALRLSDEAMKLAYTNFKDSINDHAFHDVAMDVWSVMKKAQEDAIAPPRITPAADLSYPMTQRQLDSGGEYPTLSKSAWPPDTIGYGTSPASRTLPTGWRGDKLIYGDEPIGREPPPESEQRTPWPFPPNLGQDQRDMEAIERNHKRKVKTLIDSARDAGEIDAADACLQEVEHAGKTIKAIRKAAKDAGL